MTITKAILCGMDNERACLARVFADCRQVQVFSGNDRLNLPKIVPPTVKLMLDMGLCGGIGPHVHVPDAVIATTLRHKSGEPRALAGALQSTLIGAAANCGVALKPVPYFSSGLFNTSDTRAQRIAICDAYPEHPEAMSDETRFADALTAQRRMPLQVCRVLSDSRFEDADLPPAARGHVLQSDGSVDAAFLAHSLGMDPGQIPALIKLADDLRRAMDALEALARAIKPVVVAY